MIALLPVIAAATAAATAAPPPASIDGLPIGGLARQSLPASGCAAYLFSTGQTRTLVAVAAAQAGTLRLSLEGRTIDVPITARAGAGQLGFARSSDYRTGDLAATLAMDVSLRPNLDKGAIVSDATLTIARNGRDAIILPVAGMVGCA